MGNALGRFQPGMVCCQGCPYQSGLFEDPFDDPPKLGWLFDFYSAAPLEYQNAKVIPFQRLLDIEACNRHFDYVYATRVYYSRAVCPPARPGFFSVQAKIRRFIGYEAGVYLVHPLLIALVNRGGMANYARWPNEGSDLPYEIPDARVANGDVLSVRVDFTDADGVYSIITYSVNGVEKDAVVVDLSSALAEYPKVMTAGVVMRCNDVFIVGTATIGALDDFRFESSEPSW